MNINLEDLFNLPTAVIYNPDGYKTATSVTIDSREVKKNSIFIAIRGNRLDGHKFVRSAIKKGSTAIIIHKKKINECDDIKIPMITVSDTTQAYGNLARIWRKKLDAKIISLTGSNGKTTTKEILDSILSKKFVVNKTFANNNNHIGVPLTIFSTKKDCQVLILEHGTNHFGEIEFTTKIAEPDFSLITNIGSGHLEFLIDKSKVYQEKSAIFNEYADDPPLTFINMDDPIIRKHMKEYNNKITYGFRSGSDVIAKITGYSKTGKPRLRIAYKNRKFECELPLFGKSNAVNVVASAAVAFKLGLTNKQIIQGIGNLKQVPGRFFVEQYKNFILIDDTYNSNPDSLISALEALKKINIYRKKILILGDMFELGNKSKLLHKQMAKEVLKINGVTVLTFGKQMGFMYKKILDKNLDCKHFTRRDSLRSFLKKMNLDRSTILIKGSRGMHMETLIDVIKEYKA